MAATLTLGELLVNEGLITVGRKLSAKVNCTFFDVPESSDDDRVEQ